MRILSEAKHRAVVQRLNYSMGRKLYPVFNAHGLTTGPLPVSAITTAHSRLASVASEFPFMTRRDLATWYAGVLTNVARAAVDQAPLFLVNGPTNGGSTTLLAKAAALVAANGDRTCIVDPKSVKTPSGLSDADILVFDQSAEAAELYRACFEDPSPTPSFSEGKKTPRVTCWSIDHDPSPRGLSRMRINLGYDDREGTDNAFWTDETIDKFIVDEHELYYLSALTLLHGYISTPENMQIAEPIDRYNGPLWSGFEEWSVLIAGCVEWFTGTKILAV